MPDTSDYETFFEPIAHPERWSEHDRGLVEFPLVHQRQMRDAVHPADRRKRARLTEIVTLIEAALGPHVT